MVVLDYRIVESDDEPPDLGGVDQGTFIDYYYLPGDVRFVVAGVDFSANWGWVPLLGFAYAAWVNVAEAGRSGAAVYRFTENSDELRFAADGPNVRVTATYTLTTATVDRVKLAAAAHLALLSLLKQAATVNPWVVHWPTFQAMVRHTTQPPGAEGGNR